MNQFIQESNNCESGFKLIFKTYFPRGRMDSSRGHVRQRIVITFKKDGVFRVKLDAIEFNSDKTSRGLARVN